MRDRSTLVRWAGVLLPLAAAGMLPIVVNRFSRIASTPKIAGKPPQNLTLQPADVAAAKMLKDGSIDPRFLEMHRSFLERGKNAEVRLLFLGDSITEGWGSAGSTVWTENFAAWHPANFGISGDRTQHLLWRIQNGELDHIEPRVVVLLIGTNNTDYPVDAIVTADSNIVRDIHKHLPRSKVLLLGIFPREFNPTDPTRLKIQQVNSELAKLADGMSVWYLDLGGKFLTSAGNVDMQLMPDFLHPNVKGYQIWADTMRPLLTELMR